MKFEFDETIDQRARIKVIGVGGGGGNAVNRMIEAGIDGVDFISVNTDAQDLEDSKAQTKIQIGRKLTRGLGAGGDNCVGEEAVDESEPGIENAVKEADMVFITAGMGGGTGTGAAPRIAKIAKDNNCLTVAIVTMPFDFEGPLRKKRALGGIAELKKKVDTMIVIPNQKLIQIVDRKTPLKSAFKTADTILYQATKGISDLINNQGLVNLDFADIRSIMKNKGDAIMGTGVANGDSRASMAAQLAISSPLLNDRSIRGASGILINISGGEDLSLLEYDEACKIITDEVGNNADIIVGAVEDKRFENEIVVTVIATGFPDQDAQEDPVPILHEENEDLHGTKHHLQAIEKSEPMVETESNHTGTTNFQKTKKNTDNQPPQKHEPQTSTVKHIPNINGYKENIQEGHFPHKVRFHNIKKLGEKEKNTDIMNFNRRKLPKQTKDKKEVHFQPSDKKPKHRKGEQIDLFPSFLKKNIK